MSDKENIIRNSGITTQNCMNKTKNDLYEAIIQYF